MPPGTGTPPAPSITEASRSPLQTLSTPPVMPPMVEPATPRRADGGGDEGTMFANAQLLPSRGHWTQTGQSARHSAHPEGAGQGAKHMTE